MMWVGIVLVGAVALSPFGFAAHNWYSGWKWRRQMQREWDADVQANKWTGPRTVNGDGETLH